MNPKNHLKILIHASVLSITTISSILESSLQAPFAWATLRVSNRSNGISGDGEERERGVCQILKDDQRNCFCYDFCNHLFSLSCEHEEIPETPYKAFLDWRGLTRARDTKSLKNVISWTIWYAIVDRWTRAWSNRIDPLRRHEIDHWFKFESHLSRDR